MRINNLASRLLALGELRPEGVKIVLREPEDSTVGFSLVGVSLGTIKFNNSFDLCKLPEDWRTIFPSCDRAELEVDEIEAARLALERRLNSRSWHLSVLPETALEMETELEKQGAEGIVRLNKFMTLALRLRMKMRTCSFEADSLFCIQLSQLLDRHELQALFTSCR